MLNSEEITPRACLTCEHFQLSMGFTGYSEYTPGSPPSIDCAMSRKRGCPWDGKVLLVEGTLYQAALRTVAEQCTFFEVHRDLSKREEVANAE
jgi:hypothetical protein